MGTGKLNSNLVWLFALGAILLGVGGGYVTSGMGTKVSTAVFLGVFSIAGFCAAYLTQAGTGKAIGAMVLAAVGTAVIYYFVISAITAKAVDVAAMGQGGDAGGVMGSFFGGFAAVIVLLETLVAGIAGALVGRKAKAGGLAQVAR
jgi:hypothetical protein